RPASSRPRSHPSFTFSLVPTPRVGTPASDAPRPVSARGVPHLRWLVTRSVRLAFPPSARERGDVPFGRQPHQKLKRPGPLDGPNARRPRGSNCRGTPVRIASMNRRYCLPALTVVLWFGSAAVAAEP